MKTKDFLVTVSIVFVVVASFSTWAFVNNLLIWFKYPTSQDQESFYGMCIFAALLVFSSLSSIILAIFSRNYD